MTKKIFCRAKAKSDILIAVPGEEGFTSIKSGDRYEDAIIAYKSTTFTSDFIMEQGGKNGIEVAQASAEYTLNHVDEFKTGSKIRHMADEDGEIRFIKEEKERR